MSTALARRARPGRNRFRREMPLHLMLIPAILALIVFAYVPMMGIAISFKNYNSAKGIFASPWVGLEHYRYLASLPGFFTAFRNTVVISFLKIVFSTAVPIALTLLINEVGRSGFKKFVQTATLLPFFLSWTILGYMVKDMLSLPGPVNRAIEALGGEPILFLSSKEWFRGVVVASSVWKGVGYDIIIYLAAVTNINANLYEAAAIDGCGKLKQCIHVTLPGILPIIVLMLTLNIGNLLNAGFEQILILYNSLVYETGDVIDTFIYRVGLQNGQMAVAAAVGLFRNVISLGLVSVSYYLAYRFTNYRIF